MRWAWIAAFVAVAGLLIAWPHGDQPSNQHVPSFLEEVEARGDVLPLQGNITLHASEAPVFIQNATLESRGQVSVTIPRGAELVLEGIQTTGTPGTRIHIQPGGQLSIHDSTIDAWAITVQGSLHAEASTLNLTGGAVVVDGGTLHVQDSHLESSPDDLIRATAGASIALDNATLRDAGAHGVRASDANVTWLNTHVRKTGGYALHLQGGSALLKEVDVAATADYAILAEGDAELVVLGSRLENTCVLLARDGTKAHVEDSRIATTDRGLNVHGASLTVQSSSLSGGGWLIAGENASITVTDATLQAQNLGMWLEHSTGNLAWTRFAGPGTAINASASTLEGRNLTFTASSDVLVQLAGGDADLRWNWWQEDTDPRSRGVLRGPALYAPWLHQPPRP